LAPTLPLGLIMSGHGSDLLLTEPDGRSLSGRLSLPMVLVDNSVGFVDLEIPSSGVFDQADLTALWEAGEELADWKARIAQVGEEISFATPEIVGVAGIVMSWRSLVACTRAARNLLAAWPSTLDRRLTWAPVGAPAGMEDLERTERDGPARGVASITDHGISIAQSARWVGQAERIPSVSVQRVAQAVVQLVEDTLSVEDLKRVNSLLHPIAQVGIIASPKSQRSDPDPSSWPRLFSEFVASSIRVLADLAAIERGTGALPLLDTDELYESWLAIRTRDFFDSRLGDRQPSSAGALAAWNDDEIQFELWLKPAFHGLPKAVGSEQFVSVVSDDLVPDLLISATRGEHTELAAIDAKAWAKMLPEDVLTQGAKYLYGLRRHPDRAIVPALSSVLIVTSAVRPRTIEADLAKLHVVRSTPTAEPTSLNDRLDLLIGDLRETLANREREA
jgi:hypothetical protein